MLDPRDIQDIRQLQAEDIITRHIYAEHRISWLARMRKYLAKRRIELTENMTLLFENAITVRHQILEVIFWETWNDLDAQARIREELALYSPLLPQGVNLTATLMIGGGSYQSGIAFGEALLNEQARIALVVNGSIIPARINEHNPDPADPVKFMKFDISATNVAQLSTASDIRILLQMNKTTEIQVLRPETISSLREDLIGLNIDQKQISHG